MFRLGLARAQIIWAIRVHLVGLGGACTLVCVRFTVLVQYIHSCAMTGFFGDIVTIKKIVS